MTIERSDKNNKSKKKISIFYLIPLFVLIINQGVNPMVFNMQRSTSDLAFQDNPSQLIIRGVIYFISLFIFFMNFQNNKKLLIQKKMFWAIAVYVIASVFWSGFPVKVVINWGHFLGMVLCILAARIYFVENKDRLFPFFSKTLALMVLVSIMTSLFFPSIGIGLDGRWQGVSGNPNSFGIITIASVWATLSVLHTKKENKWFYIILLLISITGMFGCGSKTAFVVSLFVFLVMYFLVSMEKASFTKKLSIMFLMGFLSIVLILIVVITMPQLLGLDGAANALGRDATFSGRTTLWEYGWKLFQLKPVVGWGFDSNMSALQYLGGGYGQFHSGYLDLLVRGGTVGFFLVIFFIMGIIKRLLNAEINEARHAMLFLTLVLAVLLHNITEASLLRGTSVFWLFIVFFYFFLDKKKVN